MDGDECGEGFLEVGEPQVDGGAQFFGGKAACERAKEPEPGDGGAAEEDECQQHAASGARQYQQIVQQAGEERCGKENAGGFGEPPGCGMQSDATLALVEKILQTRDLSQDSGGHATLLAGGGKRDTTGVLRTTTVYSGRWRKPTETGVWEGQGMGKTLWNVAEAGLVPCPSQSFRTFAADKISLIFR